MLAGAVIASGFERLAELAVAIDPTHEVVAGGVGEAVGEIE